jgi:hypothetical protein
MGEISNPDVILVRCLKGRDHSGRPGCKWEDNIKMYLKEKIMDCSALTQNSDQ